MLIPVLAVLAAVSVGVSAAFGGLEEAPDEPEQLTKGAEFDQGQVLTRFEDAVVGRAGNDGLGVPGRRYLQIIMKVTNQSDRTVSAYLMDRALPTVWADQKKIKAKDAPITSGPRIVVSSSGRSTYSQLHPGVTSTVIMAFEMRPGQQPPKSVQIDAGTFEWTKTFVSQTYEWYQVTETAPPTEEDRKKGRTSQSRPKVAAQVRLPVTVESA
ncbi:hypothetical protein GCM10022226_77430 [Sphaerisporangium flaviroseum]|uniref:DUF4352 domain-containing protein n=1 Tax=Sphaerisporangium flaviroseum TaxID=509199 RepID=A0ABP7JFU8_9ACTN